MSSLSYVRSGSKSTCFNFSMRNLNKLEFLAIDLYGLNLLRHESCIFINIYGTNHKQNTYLRIKSLLFESLRAPTVIT